MPKHRHGPFLFPLFLHHFGGVSHTGMVGLSHTATLGVTQTDFGAVEAREKAAYQQASPNARMHWGLLVIESGRWVLPV